MRGHITNVQLAGQRGEVSKDMPGQQWSVLNRRYLGDYGQGVPLTLENNQGSLRRAVGGQTGHASCPQGDCDLVTV